MSAEINLQPGDLIPPYRILELIGEGAMSRVYRAEHEKTKQIAALKILKSEWRSNEQLRMRFGREYRILQRLRHPGIMNILETGEFQYLPWMAMPYMAKGSLAHVIEARQVVSISESLVWLDKLAQAVDYINGRKIVHRDINIQNVLVDHDDELVLSDFSIAKTGEKASNATQANVILGQPRYMSPEQSYNSRSAGAAADRYSFAVIAYLLLVGYHPFTGQSDQEIIRHQQSTPLPRPGLVNPRLTKPVDTVLRRALDKTASHRYGSAHQFVKALQTAAASLSDINVAIRPWEDNPYLKHAPSERHSRMAWLLAGVIVFAAGIVGLAVLYARKPAAEQPQITAAVLPSSTATSDYTATFTPTLTATNTPMPTSTPLPTATATPTLILTVTNTPLPTAIPLTAPLILQERGGEYIRLGDTDNIPALLKPQGDSMSIQMVGGSWSPDGTRVAYSVNNDVYVMNASGSEVKQLTTDGQSNGPSWSPDGRYIMFGSIRDNANGGDIYLMNPDGTSQRRLRQGDFGGSWVGATWSPTGQQVLLIEGEGTVLGKLSIINVDGSGYDNFSFYDAGCADWSPDGKMLVWSSLNDIKVMDVASRVTRVLAPVSVTRCIWTPDSARILIELLEGDAKLINRQPGWYLMDLQGTLGLRIEPGVAVEW